MLHINLGLSDADKAERRRLLDHYAAIAQLSALLPIFIIGVRRLVASFLHPFTAAREPEIPSSPYLKSRHSTAPPAIASIATKYRALSFRARSPIHLLGSSLGTPNQLAATTVWTLWLMTLCLLETESEYLHVTKRLGLVAASQLPLHYLLSWKSLWSPVSLVTGASWEQLNAYHQWLGRIITSMLAGHAAMYLNFFVQVGVLGKRIKDWDVILGLTAIAMFLALGGTALGWVRKWNYRVFIIVHVIVAAAVLPVVWLHVSHVRIYVAESVLVLAAGWGLRWWDTRAAVLVIVEEVPGTSLVEVTIDDGRAQRWHTGQHVYLSLEDIGKWPFSIGRNPFSIASLPEDGKMKLVARVLKGNTQALTSSAKGITLARSTEVKIEGPYGVSDHVERLVACDRVLFVAGGVGATFTMPLFQALSRRWASGGRYQQADMVWSVKSLDECQWALQHLSEEDKVSFREHLTINVTGVAYANGAADGTGRASIRKRRSASDSASDERQDGVEMDSLLSDKAKGAVQSGSLVGDMHVKPGRPNVDRLVSRVFQASMTEKVGVYVCGPNIIGDKVREAVGKHIAEGRHVLFWSEEFGLS